MATPILTRHTLPGALGDLLIDVRGPKAGAAPAVVILHECVVNDRGMFLATAERLARAGFAAVLLNSGSESFTPELADLESVITALDQGRLGGPAPTSIGLLGHGRAGDTAILAASRLPRIGALVTWAAGALPDTTPAAARLHIPWLVVYGTADDTVNFSDLERALDATTAWFSRHLP